MKDFKLDNEPKITTGFTIPEGYFDTFSERFLSQIPQQESKVVSFYRTKKTWYFAAAAILVVMLYLPIYHNLNNRSEEIDSATLENYIACQSTISEDEIINLLEQKDLDKMKLEFNVEDKDIEEALNSNSNLEQYIID